MINDVTSFSFFAYVITQTQGEMGSAIYDQENHKTQKKEDNIRIFRLYLEQLLITSYSKDRLRYRKLVKTRIKSFEYIISFKESELFEEKRCI